VLVDLLIQAFEAAGADDGIIYVSVPITSGVRHLKFVRELGLSSTDPPDAYRSRWLEEVLKPNEEDAKVYAIKVKELFPQSLVVEPARIRVEGWNQEEYDTLWNRLIEQHAIRAVATPGWAFSRGARREIEVALRVGVPVLDINGNLLSVKDLAQQDRVARDKMIQDGWSERDIPRFLPPIVFEENLPGRGGDDLWNLDLNRAAAEVFAWLRGERVYQLKKFGLQADDVHTQDGLQKDRWWWTQLTNYYHRAQVLGLETVNGRQALAKFVATSCGLLESAVRLYGPLPPPGVPSGHNIEIMDAKQ
jgi:hypothetical protein